MKVCIIGPGYKPIPPTGWGAVEIIIWEYYTRLIRLNIDTTIINTSNSNNIIREVNKNFYDIVHVMYDDHVNIIKYINPLSKIYYTSHFAYLTSPELTTKYSHYFNNILKPVIYLKQRINLNVISNSIRDVYILHGFSPDRINVICNGASDDLFQYTHEPLNANRSIYLAKIEKRKKQYKYQQIDNIDFVGVYQDSSFDKLNLNYKGEWDKNTLYSHLSHYGNLVLLSDGEADPLVIKEALICGLGVVISECCMANLLPQPFITIIPNDKLDDLSYVQSEIIKNNKYSVQNRETIRAYGIQHFSWDTIINNYVKLIST